MPILDTKENLSDAGARAVTGYGWGQLVNYLTPDGTFAYCVDVQADWPSGATGPGYTATSIGAAAGTREVSGDDLTKLNVGTAQFGNTTDNDQAAAMAAFVYAYTSQNWPGHAGGLHYIADKADGHDATVIPVYNAIWDWVENNWDAGGSGSNTASHPIVMDDSLNASMTVTVDPAHANGTITLTGAVDAATGSSTVNATNGTVVKLRGIPSDDQAKYDIEATGQWSAPGRMTSEVRMYDTPGQQRIITTTGNRTPTNFTSTARTGDPLSTVFQPIVESQMQDRLVGPGGTITDHATCDIAPDSESSEWRTFLDGSSLEIPWKVALYERFPGEVELPEVPEGREVLAESTATCDSAGDVMEAHFDKPEGVTGDITAVWSIDIDAMDAVTRAFVQGPWQDAFGLDTETITAPKVTTKASDPVFDGEEYFDTATHEHAELYPETAVQVFRTYTMPKSGEQPVCDATTLVEEYAPVLVDGRTDVVSESRTANPAMGAGYYFVEATYTDDSLEELLSIGECGDPAETIQRLEKPETALASTGFDGATFGLIAAIVALLGGTLLWSRQLLRRKSATITPEAAE